MYAVADGSESESLLVAAYSILFIHLYYEHICLLVQSLANKMLVSVVTEKKNNTILEAFFFKTYPPLPLQTLSKHCTAFPICYDPHIK